VSAKLDELAESVERRKPTRQDLLIVVTRLYDLVSTARVAFENDQNDNRARDVRQTLLLAEALSLDAMAQDAPAKLRGPWAALTGATEETKRDG
jgi:hypothetical protein